MIELLDISYAVFTLILVVLGLAIVFGMLGIINMAHGEMLILGCYAVFLAAKWHLPFIFGVLMALVLTACIGAMMYRWIILPIGRRFLDTILATWGVSIVLQQVISIVFGPAGLHVDLPVTDTLMVLGRPYPLYRLLLIAMSLWCILGLYWIFFATRFGRRTRAVINNPELAACMGIDGERMNMTCFIIGAMMTGLAGALIAPMISISPHIGQDYLVPSFLSVLLGGLGSIISPILGAGMIAGIQSVVAMRYDVVVAQIVMLSTAVILLKIRPKGMFSRDHR